MGVMRRRAPAKCAYHTEGRDLNGVVHYLVSHPRAAGILIYPSELNENYTARGEFYLLGRPGAALKERYVFYAVKGEKIVPMDLRLSSGSKSLFRVDIPGASTALFLAQPVRFAQLLQQASNASEGDQVVHRRLVCLQPHVLDRVCRVHSFYFVGYSPRIR